MYTLKKFYLGESDGKKEAANRKNFDSFFYDHNGVYDEITNSNKYLILGSKGTGKTLLAEYINKKSSKSALKFCELVSFGDFQLKQIKQLRSEKSTGSEVYISIWLWIIYLEFAKLILKDQGVVDQESQAKLQSFFKNNFDSIDISTFKLVELTEKKSFGGSWYGFNGSSEREAKSEKGQYHEYLDNLIDVVEKCLKTSKSRYLLLIDELDNQFRNNETYKDNIYSLLKAADKTNHYFLKRDIKAKVILFLRMDIFNILNGPDLNKMRVDNSIALEWGNEYTKESPLFKLLFFKIRQTINEFSTASDEFLFSHLFPQPVNELPVEKYILQRTLFRPRDVIAYLNLIIHRYPDTTHFGAKGFIELERDYSERYFIQEARNELYGHIPDKMIDEGFQLLGLLRVSKFTLKQLNELYSANKKNFTEIDIEQFLISLFKVGLVSNVQETEKGYFFSSALRNPLAVMDLTKTMVLHWGLRKALNF